MIEGRKVVLFIVEGSTDKQALEKIFKKIYRRIRNIEFKCTEGDISSDEKIDKTNVESRISEIIQDYLDDQKLEKNDIFQVIQLFDMDGAYVPETAMLKGDSEHFFYTPEGIYCKNPERIRDRNKRKSEIMNYLLTVDSVKGIPYETYYMSCNLDHALYNEMNLDKDSKQEYADAFYERFIGKEDKFIDFLITDVVNGVPNSYQASWRYVKEDLHSLERHTNLHIYFTRNPKADGLL